MLNLPVRGVSMSYEEKDNNPLIPARMLNEFTYCPRLSYFEWVQGDFVHSSDTIEGRYKHRRVDKPKSLPKPDNKGTGEGRSVFLNAPNLGLTTRIDIVEYSNGHFKPVEYKKGMGPKEGDRPFDSDLVQLCAMGLILNENEYRSEYGELYYIGSKRKISVRFDDELIKLTKNKIEEMREMIKKGALPPPLVDSNKCPLCSLVGICLPDEINIIKGNTDNIRNLFPSSDDSFPLYIIGNSIYIKKKGDEIQILLDGEHYKTVPIRQISQLSFYGNGSITQPTLRELLQRGIPVCYFTFGGWFYGISIGHQHKNVDLRISQYKTAFNNNMSLKISKAFVHGKIKNCRTLLKRNDSDVPEEVLSSLKELYEKATRVRKMDQLLGIEGMAAQIYFSRFGSMITGSEFNFRDRNKRPPRDPVNAILSYMYGVLTKECFVTLLAIGFDPYLGLYHKSKYGKPSLALDLMEEFRPIVADSTVLTLFNNGEISKDDFKETSNGVSLSTCAKKTAMKRYESRLDTKIKHPIFGYRVSYRRIIEVQGRILARAVQGELDTYLPFCTR